MLEGAGDGLIEESELRELLGLSVHNLKSMWATGLQFVTVGRTSRLYLVSNLIKWFKSNQKPDAEPED